MLATSHPLQIPQKHFCTETTTNLVCSEGHLIGFYTHTSSDGRRLIAYTIWNLDDVSLSCTAKRSFEPVNCVPVGWAAVYDGFTLRASRCGTKLCFVSDRYLDTFVSFGNIGICFSFADTQTFRFYCILQILLHALIFQVLVVSCRYLNTSTLASKRGAFSKINIQHRK